MKSFYVRGISRNGHGQGVMHLVQTQNGWTQRVLEGDFNFCDCLNFDYVSKESEEDLKSWLRCDMRRMNIISDLKGLQEEATDDR